MIINLALVAIIAVVAASLWWRGLWTGLVSFLAVLAAGTVAAAWYETVAAWLDHQVPDYHYFLDFIAFWALFAATAGLMFAVTLGLRPAAAVRFDRLVERIGAVILAVMTGWMTAEIAAFSLHLAPLRTNALPMPPEETMLLGLGPERWWLWWTRGATANGPFAVPERRFDPDADFFARHAVRREILATEMTIFSPGR